MQSRFLKRSIQALLITATFLVTGGLKTTTAQDADNQKAWSALSGEWIRYNGHNIETKVFNNGTETHTSYNEYGLENRSVTAQLELVNEAGSIRFSKTNFRLADPELAKTHGVFQNWQGSVDELGIWSRVLTDEEVARLWNDGQGSAVTAESNKSLMEELIGYWPFDGNLVEKTGTGRDGTGMNKPGFAAGALGQALKLDGSTQYVTLGGKASDYEPDNGVISISVWCQADELDTVWQSLISKGQNNNWRIHRHWQQGRLSSAGLNVLRNPVRIDDHKFHHVVAVMESEKQVTFYVDNQKVVEATSGFLGRNRRLPMVGADLGWTQLTGGYVLFDNTLWEIFTNNNGDNDVARSYRRTSHPQEALLIAARQGDLEAAMKSLKAGADVDGTSSNSYTALGYAAASGHLDLMDHLLDKGANVNLKTRFGKTPLVLVAGTEHFEAANLLLSNGASLDARSNHGGSSAHEAIFWQQPEMLDHLLKNGHDVNVRANNPGNQHGFQRTPLHWAVFFLETNNPTKNRIMQECIEVLLAHQADTSLKGNQGKTAAQMAEEKGFSILAKQLE